MFSRSFMRAFNANKYSNPVRIGKDVTETPEFIPSKDMPYFRFFTGAAVLLLMWQMYESPGPLYEVFFHPHYPGTQIDSISRGVPKQVREPNEQVLENARKLHQIQEFITDYKQ